MSNDRISYEELQTRLDQAEAMLGALHQGKVDLLIGDRGPMVIRMRSLVEAKERLQILLDILRRISRLIIHEDDMQKLLQSAVNCFCAGGLFHGAWIVKLNESGGTELIVGGNTFGLNNVNGVLAAESDFPYLKKILASPGPMIIGDLPSQPDIFTRMKRSENCCLIGVPLHYGDHNFGALLILAPQAMEKDEDTHSLWAEIGGDLGFALYRIADIPKRKHEETQLVESDRNLHEVVRAGKIGLWTWDLKTNKVTYSREWKRQIGYEDHEIGNDYAELEKRIHPDDLQSTRASVKKSIREINQNHRTEFRFRHKNGSYRWILVQASFLLNAEGHPMKMIGSHIDITSQKMLEDALRQSQLKYRTMIESMTDAIYICSSDLIVEYMNPKMIERAGQDRTGEPCYRALHGLDHQCDDCVFDMIAKGQSFETNIVSPLGVCRI